MIYTESLLNNLYLPVEIVTDMISTAHSKILNFLNLTFNF